MSVGLHSPTVAWGKMERRENLFSFFFSCSVQTFSSRFFPPPLLPLTIPVFLFITVNRPPLSISFLFFKDELCFKDVIWRKKTWCRITSTLNWNLKRWARACVYSANRGKRSVWQEVAAIWGLSSPRREGCLMLLLGFCFCLFVWPISESCHWNYPCSTFCGASHQFCSMSTDVFENVLISSVKMTPDLITL